VVTLWGSLISGMALSPCHTDFISCPLSAKNTLQPSAVGLLLTYPLLQASSGHSVTSFVLGSDSHPWIGFQTLWFLI
jgi:hypothetical protein